MQSHIYTYFNLLMAAGLPMDKKKKVPELDYGACRSLVYRTPLHTPPG